MANQNEANAVSVLNELVANQGVLYVKLHQYHWYVQGPHFFTLHEKFEQLYNETTNYFDRFAERIVALGKKPYSTLKEYLVHATIAEKPYTEEISAEEMVQNLIQDFETVKKLSLKGISLASEKDDAVTEDMLVEYVEYIDMTLWMLRAFLGKV